MRIQDLMTAKQALDIIDILTELQNKVTNLENEVKALRTELAWHEVNQCTEYYNAL